jgi:hypothetical protein
VTCEAYLSAFMFGDDFQALLTSTGSCRGYQGACWSPWLWFDIDRAENLESGRRDAARLALFNVRMRSALCIVAIIFANIQSVEACQPSLVIAINPNTAVVKLYTRW